MKIAVAMSGGVDSSVTAALLKQQGHQVFGITMRLFEPCCSGAGSAAHDAAAVAKHLGIEHILVDYESQFRELIIADFIDEYRRGHTPNPCVRCNRYVKFGLLLDTAKQHGADYLATGHYVRKTVDPDGECHLRMARNLPKDQSYFLYGLSRERLAQTMFPLGEVANKDQVRQLAREFDLPVAEKGDSQEVCFIPGDDYVAYLQNCGSLTVTGGDIVHVSGKTLGRHNGTYRYTIGQRKGLGIAWSEPLYVVSINVSENRVVVGEQGYLLAPGLQATDMNWIIHPGEERFECSCKIRYRHQPVPCTVQLSDGACCEVIFKDAQRSVTAGQSLVLYRQDEVLGGGIIVAPSRE